MTEEIEKEIKRNKATWKSWLLLVGSPFLVTTSITELGNSVYIFSFLILAFQIGFSIMYLLERVAENVSIERSYLWFVKQVVLICFFVTLFFASDFIVLSMIDETNWSVNGVRDFFDFFYYSFMTLTTVGYDQIVPTSIISKIFTMMEVLVSIAILIFILAGYELIKTDYIKKNHFAVGNIKKPKEEKESD